jgi:hypothetical protein
MRFTLLTVRFPQAEAMLVSPIHGPFNHVFAHYFFLHHVLSLQTPASATSTTGSTSTFQFLGMAVVRGASARQPAPVLPNFY